MMFSKLIALAGLAISSAAAQEVTAKTLAAAKIADICSTVEAGSEVDKQCALLDWGAGFSKRSMRLEERACQYKDTYHYVNRGYVNGKPIRVKVKVTKCTNCYDKATVCRACNGDVFDPVTDSTGLLGACLGW